MHIADFFIFWYNEDQVRLEYHYGEVIEIYYLSLTIHWRDFIEEGINFSSF